MSKTMYRVAEMSTEVSMLTSWPCKITVPARHGFLSSEVKVLIGATVNHLHAISCPFLQTNPSFRWFSPSLVSGRVHSHIRQPDPVELGPVAHGGSPCYLRSRQSPAPVASLNSGHIAEITPLMVLAIVLGMVNRLSLCLAIEDCLILSVSEQL